MKKQLGQNFLTSTKVAKKMVAALKLRKNDYLVEIGAGMGAVTREIVDEVKRRKIKVTVLEIDKRFVKDLKDEFSHYKYVEIVRGDVLQWLPALKTRKPFKVIGSLPYYITSPILHALVRHKGNVRTAVLLIQKEVAKKIAADAPKASYLSAYLQTFFDIEILEIVPRELFKPQPKVDGAVVKLTKRKKIAIRKKEILDYEEFLHKGFSKPRKMLNKVFSKKFLQKLKTDDKLRPQHIDTQKWIELYLKAKTNSQ
jgi:16S rRNA (adenine1518-N6/adenine1519-N6)-dimethyltransferase